MRLTFTLFMLAILQARAVPQQPPVYVVLFTHIEDNTPVGVLGSAESRINYLNVRSKLIEMSNLAFRYKVAWSLQPDWKILLAALSYEDSVMRVGTNGKNIFRYLKEDKSVIIDPHSHENGGYNYTDVAHLLDSLGVGATTVIGGHIWDPTIPQFQGWDRFRLPVRGTKYPWAIWRGAILMGSGTPNHVNDPIVSGVWRPRDRFNYFADDPSGNVTAIGQFRSDIDGVSELSNLYTTGRVAPTLMLTSSYHIKPADITAVGGIAVIESTVVRPFAALRESGRAKLSDFTSLVGEWQSTFQGRTNIYRPPLTAVLNDRNEPAEFRLLQNYPNPFNPQTAINFQLSAISEVNLRVTDILGREVETLLDAVRGPGVHTIGWDASSRPSGVYFCHLRVRALPAGSSVFMERKKMVLSR